MGLYMAHPPVQGCLQHLPSSWEWSSGLETYVGICDTPGMEGRCKWVFWDLKGLWHLKGENAGYYWSLKERRHQTRRREFVPGYGLRPG